MRCAPFKRQGPPQSPPFPAPKLPLLTKVPALQALLSRLLSPLSQDPDPPPGPAVSPSLRFYNTGPPVASPFILNSPTPASAPYRRLAPSRAVLLHLPNAGRLNAVPHVAVTPSLKVIFVATS